VLDAEKAAEVAPLLRVYEESLLKLEEESEEKDAPRVRAVREALGTEMFLEKPRSE
jgi:hypothetical protein